MSLDEMMMHAMRDAYAYAAKMRAGSLPHEPMRAVLDLLHANGYRRCAEGQRTTQWCDRANKAEAEVERLQLAYDDQHAVASLMHQQAEKAEAEVERLRAVLFVARHALEYAGGNWMGAMSSRPIWDALSAIDAARGES